MENSKSGGRTRIYGGRTRICGVLTRIYGSKTVDPISSEFIFLCRMHNEHLGKLFWCTVISYEK